MLPSPSSLRRRLRIVRHRRLRVRIEGSASRPRLSVFRSHKHIRVQLINDAAGTTLLGMDDRMVKGKKETPYKDNARMSSAYMLGKALAEKAKEQHITSVVFDRGGYAYHGRVRAIAEGARDGGLVF